jgi:ppGpp synthetase/RelA/SpoT-type nucleotidyltranferase
MPATAMPASRLKKSSGAFAVGEMDFAALAAAYEEERPVYKRLGKEVATQLEAALQTGGIRGSVSSRPKDTTKFLEKALRKDYADPLSEIHDKAGARVVVVYREDVARVREVARERFEVLSEEDTSERLGENILGYLGYHMELTLKDASDEELKGKICELQIHTRVQSAWADVSHDLLYKSRRNPPETAARRIWRLEAFVELFDEEVQRARDEILAHPGHYEAKLLAFTEPHFYRLGGTSYDVELAIQALGTVKTLLSPAEQENIIQLIEGFVTTNEKKLRKIFDQYKDVDRRDPLLLQPSSILVFNRIEVAQAQLAEKWAASLPWKSLEVLSTVWGEPLEAV